MLIPVSPNGAFSSSMLIVTPATVCSHAYASLTFFTNESDTRRKLQPAPLLGDADRLDAAVGVELLHDRREVVAGRARREVQRGGELGDGAVAAGGIEHLLLARGE